jgi:hypothetical protein
MKLRLKKLNWVSFVALIVFGFAFYATSANAELNYDSDVPAALHDQLVQDLSVITSLEGTQSPSTTYAKIFGISRLDGKGLLKFFEDRITGFGMDECGGGPAVAACVQPFLDHHKMWITPNYIRFNAPLVYRLSVVFHESRHTEAQNGNWHHATCPTPYVDENGNDIKGILSGTLMAGRPACDTTVLGAYSLQATLLKAIERTCVGCTEKFKQDAQIFGDDTVNRISDVPKRQALRKDLNGGA